MEMNIQNRLLSIRSQNYINELPMFVKERGFVFSENQIEKDILITGFNPSFLENEKEKREDEKGKIDSFNFHDVLRAKKPGKYFSSLKKLIFDPGNNIDLINRTAYVDIFYFREKNQSSFKKDILKSPAGIRFAVDQLNLTQHAIEDVIKPKVIIVKNKESAAYWGKLASKGLIWMGYQLDFIDNLLCGELFKISGLLNSPERIAPEITDTNLKDSLVLFSQYRNQYTSKKEPTATVINGLLENYFQSKNELSK